MLLVGSGALRHWFPREARQPRVWDIWAEAGDFEDWPSASGARVTRSAGREAGGQVRVRAGDVTLGVTLVKPGSSEALFIRANARSEFLPGPLQGIRVARPGSLLLIKRSHLDDPLHWHKHIADYHFLKKQVPDASITAADRRAYAQRCRERSASASRELSMQVPNEVFFARYKHSAIRLYVHDDLHRATCHYDAPLYERLKSTRSRAYVERKRFARLSHDDRILLVREESYAMALERVLLPARELGVSFSPRHAFLHALHRICTDLTSGWFRDFAIEHYPEIAADDSDFVGRFENAVRRGVIHRQAPERLGRTTRAALRAQLRRITVRDVQSGLPRIRTRSVRDFAAP